MRPLPWRWSCQICHSGRAGGPATERSTYMSQGTLAGRPTTVLGGSTAWATTAPTPCMPTTAWGVNEETFIRNYLSRIIIGHSFSRSGFCPAPNLRHEHRQREQMGQHAVLDGRHLCVGCCPGQHARDHPIFGQLSGSEVCYPNFIHDTCRFDSVMVLVDLPRSFKEDSRPANCWLTTLHGL